MGVERRMDGLVVFICFLGLLAFLQSIGFMGCANSRPPVMTLEQWQAEDNRVRSKP
jgi:hypothetical protein